MKPTSMSHTTSSKLEQLIKIPEEQQITLHCFHGSHTLSGICNTAFLRCAHTGRKAWIIHALNIPWFPNRKLFSASEPFTLMFEPFSKQCVSFDFVEEMPMRGVERYEKNPDFSPQYEGYMKINIPRNKTDVYSLKFT